LIGSANAVAAAPAPAQWHSQKYQLGGLFTFTFSSLFSSSLLSLLLIFLAFFFLALFSLFLLVSFSLEVGTPKI